MTANTDVTIDAKRTFTWSMMVKPMMVMTFAVVGICALAAEHVHQNRSNSLPIVGPFLVWRPNGIIAHLLRPNGNIEVGDLIQACPPIDTAREALDRRYVEPGDCPGGVAPFLKLVAATAGDVVTTTPAAVLVNGHRLPQSAQIMRDSAGRVVLTRPLGTYVLLPNQIWLYGTSIRSLDSRKFGPVAIDAVRFFAWAPFVSEPFPDLPAITGRQMP